MKLTMKPLKAEPFEVEVEPTLSIEDLKKKIQEARPEFLADQQKLIYQGRILADATPISDYGIKENEFIVVMVAKAKPPAGAPAPAATPAAAPTAAPAGGDAAAPAPGGETPAAYEQAAATLVSGSGMEPTIQQLCDMGFERPQVERCLQAAFNNPDRAVEYLMSGIPEGILAPPGGEAEAPPAAPPGGAPAPGGGAAPFPSMTAAGGGAGGATPFPAMGGAAAGGGGGAGGEDMAALAALREHPRFQQLAQMVQQNPQVLAQILPALAQSNPEIAQVIAQNPQAFMAMLRQSAGGGGGGEDPVAAMISAAEGGGGGAPGGMPGMPGGPGGPTVVRLTEEEGAAVQRLTELGFDRNTAVQAYLACDKNEELAANFLFENAMGD